MLRLMRFSAPRDHYHPKVLASRNGLLVVEASKSPPVHFIYNHVTQEQATLRGIHGLLGLFYNSLARKYGFLCITGRATGALFYYILNCKRRSSRVIGTFRYAPSIDEVPALNFDDCVHRVARLRAPYVFCIIIFGVDRESCLFMPLPEDSCQHRYERKMEGQSCFAYFSSTSRSIKIWVVEEFGNWLWAERFNVNLESIGWILWW